MLRRFYDQQWPPAPTFDVKRDIPDLTGKVAIVTGGNSGTGYETAKELLRHNATVYLGCRNETRAKDAIENLKKECDGKEARFLPLDLSSFASIKRAVDDFTQREQRLDILYNNGGGMTSTPEQRHTEDGYDMTFGVNLVGPFYLTKLLLPTLISSAKSSPTKHVRVVNVSSFASELTSHVDIDLQSKGNKRLKANPNQMYFQAKFGTVVFSNELARRYGDQGIVSTSVHPGTIRSNFQRNMTGLTRAIIMSLTYPQEMGALTMLYAGTVPEGDGFNGQYLNPWGRLVPPNPASKDMKIREELWNWLDAQVKDI
ncbi:NAD(P)-binding protein [Cylindrobasidium torrendii FP15055 ss-10]|uniref:NAD(P)-binding protein n=1 Tax=Cylindrobasidium torrendii FP15055 ss-10 TaxID=1314674 RepID=A0A0D7BCE1_9AGAR|nr:NAD(P)-binding protein [Cylindrobasidium torrendii FP15055 ss-10]